MINMVTFQLSNFFTFIKFTDANSTSFSVFGLLPVYCSTSPCQLDSVNAFLPYVSIQYERILFKFSRPGSILFKSPEYSGYKWTDAFCRLWPPPVGSTIGSVRASHGIRYSWARHANIPATDFPTACNVPLTSCTLKMAAGGNVTVKNLLTSRSQ